MKHYILGIILCSLSLLASSAEATPFYVDLGPQNEVLGVTRLADGTALLVGSGVDSGGTRRPALYTVAPDGLSFSVAYLSGPASSILLSGISQNGDYISGSGNTGGGNTFQGLVWRRNELSDPETVGFLPAFPETFAFDVSNTGVAVGVADGGFTAFHWSSSDGISAYSLPSEGAAATAITADGRLAVGFQTNSLGAVQASLWTDGGQVFLEDPFKINSRTDDVVFVGDEVFVGGQVSSFDFETFSTVEQAAVWLDGDLTLLTDAENDPFEGRVLGVTTNGFAVGESALGAFIWNESFGHVRLFDEWLLTEFGMVLPTPALALKDAYFDGVNINFAVKGSAYFVSVPLGSGAENAVPEPTSSLLLLSGIAYGVRSRRKTVQY